MMKFAIIDEMHDSIITLLSDIGVSADYLPYISKEEAMSIIKNYDGVIVRSKVFIDEDFLINASKLKFICRAGAGIDNLDVASIEKRSIKIINAPEGNSNAVAEHCLGLMLSLINNINKANREVKNMLWNREGNRGYECHELNLGIIGYGHMGRAFAKKAGGLMNSVLAYDKYKSGFGEGNIRSVDIDVLFEETDILSIHVPLTTETKQMIDYSFLKQFKKEIWLINTSRGEVLSLKGLSQCLEEGKVRAAALDVLENEKLDTLKLEQLEIFNILKDNRNVILTPHVAGWTFTSYQKINEVLADKLKRCIKE